MTKLMTAFFVLLSFTCRAQSVFYYGNDSVSAKDFLKAYHKNNTGQKTEKAFRDYLDLYIASKLKVHEAKVRGYDTLPQLVADLDNLRQQIMPNYLTDKEGTSRLVDEAFTRAQKDIHLAHIFIFAATDPGGKKFDEALAAVKKSQASGGSFTDIAKKYSDDPSAKDNGGDLGWLTVFSLPYELENLAYSIPVGQTGTYVSKVGFHIFKNLGERKDPGRIKAAQILLAFPPNSSDATKASTKKLADSLYNLLLKGTDFGALASQYSNDVLSAAANGQMQEFGVGQYDPIFEKQAYSLTRDGAFTKPFMTSHGYHIVKRLGKTPPPSNKNDKKLREILQTRVEQSDRINTTKAALAKKILKQVYKKDVFDQNELFAFSDSIINYRPAGMPITITYATNLFHLGDRPYTVSDWMNYAQTFRYRADGSGIKPYAQIWDEFLNASAMDYYQTHLEYFNEDFKQQLSEFKEGNLFFEIMQREVWGPSQTDSVAIENYFNAHKSNYVWKQSADAVIFYAADLASANTFSVQLKKAPRNWKELVSNFSEKITADSARFELSQIPNSSKQALKAGTITSVSFNKADNTASFAYIIRNYDKPGPRSFVEARGLVVNDYQRDLDARWVKELKQKYPVRVNEKVVTQLVREKKY